MNLPINLHSVLTTIFHTPAQLPIEVSKNEQVVLGKEFHKMSGDYLEDVPRHLVQIQLLIAREKEALRKIMPSEHSSLPLHTAFSLARDSGRLTTHIGEAGAGVTVKPQERVPGPREISRELVWEMHIIEVNIGKLKELFDLLNNDHIRSGLANKVPERRDVDIRYDESRNRIVYVIKPPVRAREKVSEPDDNKILC